MTTSFRDAYGVLQKHAETLRDQHEPNIDDLLTIVTESVEAYRVCKARIDAVEVALKAALDGVDTQPSVAQGGAASRGTQAPHVASSAPHGESMDDDDIPF